MPLTIGCILEARLYIVAGKIWKILQDLFRCHTRSKIFQNIINSDAQTADTRFSSPLAGLDRNDVYRKDRVAIEANGDEMLLVLDQKKFPIERKLYDPDSKIKSMARKIGDGHERSS